MELRSISASSIQVFEGCTYRYQVEMVDRVPTPGGSSEPARLGTAVHDTLEIIVQRAHIDKTHDMDWPDIVAFFKQNFMKQFNRVPDPKDPWYADGIEMLDRWFQRTQLENVEVLMVERKIKVEIKTSAGPKPYTFIFDRLDRFEEDGKSIVRIVDYKTWRQHLTPEALRQKPQGRLYGMAIMLAKKEIEKELGFELNPDEIWVCFDQLRYDPVEVKFTRDDNVATWKYIRKVAERIIAEPEPGKRTLNSECQFCPVKATCPALTKNIEAGGIMMLAGDRDAMARRYAELEGAQKAIRQAIEEVQEELLKSAIESDEIEFDTENFHVAFKSSRRKSYDPATVREIIGDNLFSSMGKINNSEVDKLLKGNALTPIQKSRLRSSVRESIGEPRPKVVPRLIKE
ncbi:Cas4 family exonuclease [Gordonia phage Jams]|nr:Cas4 family exonuclease [Gordonia phage Shelley]UVK60769.1 Cas4 family exonuclease [Gordonia phage Bianmat]UVK61747.1 Cas4 family exonuclease [Gordonia phage MrWormie]UVK62768.1 Cas4 family exonuclease [Gordonia phage Lidong]UXE04923.1 Cas4 family exonuclease [Gordonia phage Jams]UYL87212.1 Cas4 family exonuclease [Gordonia phage Minos]WAA19575.1 Cas4-like exonuclease [Gordonia phage GalacticEye]